MTKTPNTAEHWESVHDGLDELYGAGEISFAVALDRAREVGRQLELLRTSGEPSDEQVERHYRLFCEARLGRKIEDPEHEATQSQLEKTWIAEMLAAAAVTPQPGCCMDDTNGSDASMTQVDEAALAEVIGETESMYNIWYDEGDLVRESKKIARAVVAWLKGGAR